MDSDPRVAAVCGSRSADSATRVALRHALEAAADAGATTDLIDLGAVDLPLYHPDRDDADSGDAVAVLERTAAADAVLVGSPVYHGSYASAFKSYHDYCGSDEFEDTVVGLVAVAGGSNYGRTLEHMRSTLAHVGADVLSEEVGVPSGSSAVADGRVVDEDVADRLDSLARSAVARVAAHRGPGAATPPAED